LRVDSAPLPCNLLVHQRTQNAQLAVGEIQHQLTRRVEAQALGAFNGHLYLAGADAGVQDERELELLAIPVIFEIHTAIDTLVTHAAEMRNVGHPLPWIVAAKVMALARELLLRLATERRVGSDKFQLNKVAFRRRFASAVECQPYFAALKRYQVVAPTCQEFRVGGFLSYIPLESKITTQTDRRERATRHIGHDLGRLRTGRSGGEQHEQQVESPFSHYVPLADR
jgi:hypothetical protein